MRIIALKTLQEFWEYHADAEQPLKAWFDHARHADWKTPTDIKKDYTSASILAGNRVVFNLKGNTYRLIVAIHFQSGIIFIRFCGTNSSDSFSLT